MQQTLITSVTVLGLLAGSAGLCAQEAATSKVSAVLWDLVVPLPAPVLGPPVMTASGPQAAEILPALAATSDGKVLISAVANADAAGLAAELAAMGATHCAVAGRVVSALLPLEAIPLLDGLTELKFARAGLATANAGLVTSQADAALRADVVRGASALSGAGIRVGILSDSFDALGGMDDGILSGDLPADIDILADVTGTTDEGRAMGEIIHDVAPGAALGFHTAWRGVADFANGIRALRDAGCQVIVDDVIYFEEPMFADGVVAQAVDEVTADGVAYFSAAGNAGRNSWEAPFRGSAGGYNDFNPDTAVDEIMNITLLSGTTWFLVQWADRYASASPSSPGAATDLDIELVYPDGRPMGNLGAFSANVGGDPSEEFGVTVTKMYVTAGLRIRHKAGPIPPRIKLVWYCSVGMGWLEYYNASNAAGTLFGHMNARGAMATGAVRYCKTPAFGQNPPLLESWSSVGGLAVYFAPDGTPAYELRQKPEFCAPQGGDNTFFGDNSDCGSSTGYPNFYGTSAAAPHAAGVAALMLEARPATTPERLCKVLQETAVDMGTAGFDFESGYGLVQADAALEQLTQPPPVLQSVVSRKKHGSVGSFDIPLPMTGAVGVEGRSGTQLQLVFQFDRPISEAANARVVSGTAAVEGAPLCQGTEVRVQLASVANSQKLEIQLEGVAAEDGGYLVSATSKFAVLTGDVTGDAAVNVTDVYIVRSASGQWATVNNFRSDLDATGAVNVTDVYMVRSASGQSLPR